MEHIIDPPPKYKSKENYKNRQFLSNFNQRFVINKSIEKLKPICFYFYKDSLKNKVRLGLDEDDDIVIYKDNDSYSSNIISLYKLKSIYVCETENTLYIVSNKIVLDDWKILVLNSENVFIPANTLLSNPYISIKTVAVPVNHELRKKTVE